MTTKIYPMDFKLVKNLEKSSKKFFLHFRFLATKSIHPAFDSPQQLTNLPSSLFHSFYVTQDPSEPHFPQCLFFCLKCQASFTKHSTGYTFPLRASAVPESALRSALEPPRPNRGSETVDADFPQIRQKRHFRAAESDSQHVSVAVFAFVGIYCDFLCGFSSALENQPNCLKTRNSGLLLFICNEVLSNSIRRSWWRRWDHRNPLPRDLAAFHHDFAADQILGKGSFLSRFAS